MSSSTSMTIATNASSTSTTTVFKTSLQLQTPKSTTASVTAALNVTDEDAQESDPNEARYWMYNYGLGTHTYQRSQRKFAHPRKLVLRPSEGAAIVQQVLFGPAATEQASSNINSSKNAPLAVVGGPRVYLYGTNGVSAFARHLARHSTSTTTTTTTSTNSTQAVAADRHVQTGGHLALAAAFRNDGRLLAVGTDVGEVRVCDVTMRATLCTFVAASATKLPVRAVAWYRNGKNILSGGDDGVLRVWNLSSSSQGGGRPAGSGAMLELAGHGDSIRAAILWQEPTNNKRSQQQKDAVAAWSQLAFSGSYDHTIRVWNVQQDGDNVNSSTCSSGDDDNRCLAVLSHGAPVEALLTMPSTDPNVPVWLLSAGGVTVKVWNPLSGECVTTITTQHRKTITALTPVLRRHNNNSDDDDHNTTTTIPSWRIVTGSLDGCIRIHQWSSQTGSLLHIHGLKVGDGAPITALAVNNESGAERIAIGTTTGMVFVRQKGASITQHKRKRPPRAGTFASFTRGMNTSFPDAVTASANSDYLLGGDGEQSNNKKRKLRKFDQCLKQFRYGDALDEAMETRMPSVVVAVLEELGKRRGLLIALSNRDEETLEPVLAFLVRYVTRPRFTSVLVGVAHSVIDIYGDVAGQSEMIDELFVKLKMQVRNECRAQKSLLKLIGQLDAIMAPNYVITAIDD